MPPAKPAILDTRQLTVARQAQASRGRLDRLAEQLGLAAEEEALRAVGESLGLD